MQERIPYWCERIRPGKDSEHGEAYLEKIRLSDSTPCEEAVKAGVK
jgi:hypothetical protein